MRRQQIAYEGVVVEPVVHRLTLGNLVFRKTSQGFCDVVAVLLQQRGHRVELLQGWRQFFFVVCHQAGQLLRQRRGVGQQIDDRVTALVQHPQQIVGVEQQGVDLLAALRQNSGDVSGVRQQFSQRLVAAAQCLRQPSQSVERRPQLWPESVDRVRQRIQGLIQRAGVGAGGVGREVTDSVGQRVGGRRAVQRDDVGRVQGGAAGRLQGEHARAQHRPGPDVGGGAGPEVDLTVDAEGHQGFAVAESDIGDGAHFDAGHFDVVARGEPAGLGEQRLVSDGGRHRPQLFGLQSDGDDEHDQNQADKARPDMLESTVFQHQGSPHRPVFCRIQGKWAVRP